MHAKYASCIAGMHQTPHGEDGAPGFDVFRGETQVEWVGRGARLNRCSTNDLIAEIEVFARVYVTINQPWYGSGSASCVWGHGLGI
jgi:hypothetical protein